MSRRLERVADLLRAEIARVLREELGDPRVALVTVTRVDVSPDLRNATVLWSRIEQPGAAPLADVEAALGHAASFVRHRLAREVHLKRMPALRFRHDSSLELGDRTLELLRDVSDGPPR